MSKLKRFIGRHRVASALFALGSVAVLVFLVRFLLAVFVWHGQLPRNVTPEAWMTPNFIAHSWHVDTRELAEAVGLNEKPEGRPTLADIAALRGVPVQQVIDEAAAFLAQKGSN